MGEPSKPSLEFSGFAFGIRRNLPSLDSGWSMFAGDYLLYAATGGFHLDVDDAQWFLPPQRAAWVAAGTPIRIWSQHPVTSSSVLFGQKVRDPLLAPCCVFAPSALAREMILYAMRWASDRADDPAARPFFEALAGLCNELAGQPERFWLPRALSDTVKSITSYIHEHLARPLSIAGLAQVVHVSERTLARRFTQELSMTCGQFIHRARMLRAMELLTENNQTITEIAGAVGFESLSAFTSGFRVFTQESPTQYRKRVLASG